MFCKVIDQTLNLIPPNHVLVKEKDLLTENEFDIITWETFYGKQIDVVGAEIIRKLKALKASEKVR
jgi:hypothetical protein